MAKVAEALEKDLRKLYEDGWIEKGIRDRVILASRRGELTEEASRSVFSKGVLRGLSIGIICGTVIAAIVVICLI